MTEENIATKARPSDEGVTLPLFPTLVYHASNVVNEEWLEATKKKMLNIDLGIGELKGDAATVAAAFFGDHDHQANYGIDTTWLFEVLGTHIKKYFESMGVNYKRYDINVQKWWPVVTGRGGIVQRHTHYNAHYSAVYYLDVPPPQERDPGCLMFYSPEDYFPRRSGICIDDRGVDVTATFVPTKGDLVIFPANLMHAVTPNDHDQKRLSISMDVFLTRNEVATSDTDEMGIPPMSNWTEI